MGFLRDMVKDGKAAVKSTVSGDGNSSRNSQPQEYNPMQNTQEGLYQAYQLVGSACEDLQRAIIDLDTKGGLMAGGKAAVKSGGDWNEAGGAAMHNGRNKAVDLIQSAHGKYEQAAQLADWLPEVAPAEVKQGKVQSGMRSVTNNDAVSGSVGAAVNVTTSVVGMAFTAMPVGLIAKAVGKRRTKKAVGTVNEMLAEYQAALQSISAALQQRR